MSADEPGHASLKATFTERAQQSQHPLTKYLFRLMELKKSNLCLSADVSSARELLQLADRTGPSIVVLKTHHDIVSGWDYHPQTGTGSRLAALGRKHGFLIFEDRKFGDIGSTVQMQYTAGNARIIDWAHIVNVNMVPGKASVEALVEAHAKWRSRVNYEVKTSVSVGTPLSDAFDEDVEGADQMDCSDDADHLAPLEPHGANSLNGSSSSNASNGITTSGLGSTQREPNDRKGSIVSVTTVTQSYEPADSPRFANGYHDGEDALYAGIEEPPWDRGLLILAQMSSTGNFMGPEYTKACLATAREHKDFVLGFVSQESLNVEPEDQFIHMTPGCQLPLEGDDENSAIEGILGQNYNTPAKLVGLCGSDIVIVGRGIFKAGDPESEAERYRLKAWKAYQQRTASIPV